MKRSENGASGRSPVARSAGRVNRTSAGSAPRRHVLPILVLVLAVPLWVGATLQGAASLGRPFPGFLLMENAVVPTVSGYDWPPDRAAVFHARVLAVDGRPVAASRDVYSDVARLPAGTRFAYTIEKGGQTTTLELASRIWTWSDWTQVYGVFLFFSLCSLASGIVVGFLQPATRQARVFVLQAFVAGAYAASAPFLHWPSGPLLGWICLAFEALFPATFIHLALVFPQERPHLRRIWLVLPYAVSVLLFVATVRGFAADPPGLESLHWTYRYTAASVVFFIGSLLLAARTTADVKARLRVRAILPGLIVGTTVMAVLFLDNALEGGSLPIQAGLPLSVFFYASVAYAIAKHDLFDVDRVVRQALEYALATVLVLLAYAAFIAAPGLLGIGRSGYPAPLALLGLVALALALEPLRRGVQGFVDRAFYRARQDSRATISRVAEAMTGLLELDAVADQLTRVVSSSLALELVAVYLCPDDDAPGRVWIRTPSDDREYVETDETLDRFAQLVAQPSAPFVADDVLVAAEQRGDDVAPLRERLEGLSVVGALPLAAGERCLGVILLGPRRSGAIFTSDDVDLLRTLANQTAVAVKNAQSYRRLQELTRGLERKVAERTVELADTNRELEQAIAGLKQAQARLVQSEKMASLGRLVAGAAHELNNPASFVAGGVENLAEYFGRIADVLAVYERTPIPDAALRVKIHEARESARLDYVITEMPRLLAICAEGSDRIRRIVRELRIFARADSGRRDRLRVGMRIASTVEQLGDRLGRGGIAVDLSDDAAAEVRADTDLLDQVWTNLLTNAIDAVAGVAEPRIRVSIRAASVDQPSVEVRIEDNGCGIPEAVLGRVFEPFFTTKPLGEGTGLGLSIAFGAVEAHEGTLELVSREGEGTTAIVRLPAEPPGTPAAVVVEAR